MMRFDRFTERAQDSVKWAYQVLQRYGHGQVDTEHLLLALIEQPEGMIPAILEQMGVDLEAISRLVDEELKRTPRTHLYGGDTGQMYITPRLKRVIDLSIEEAFKLEDDYVSTKHLFLSIVNEGNSASARILAEQGVTRYRILEAITQIGNDDTIRRRKAQRAERRRAVLQPRPLADVTIEAVTGDDPALVLVQGEDTITVKLPQVLALVGALANAALNLAEAAIREQT